MNRIQVQPTGKHWQVPDAHSVSLWKVDSTRLCVEGTPGASSNSVLLLSVRLRSKPVPSWRVNKRETTDLLILDASLPLSPLKYLP